MESRELTPGCLVRLPSAWGRYSAILHKKSDDYTLAYGPVYIYGTDILIYIRKAKTYLDFSSEQVDIVFCIKTQRFLEVSCGVFEPLEEDQE
jgi:hypothetical protein